MPPDPPREQGPPGLATPTQINATPTSKTVENPVTGVHEGDSFSKKRATIKKTKPISFSTDWCGNGPAGQF